MTQNNDHFLTKSTLYLLGTETLIRMSRDLTGFARDLCTDIGSELRQAHPNLEQIELYSNDLNRMSEILKLIDEVLKDK